MEGAGVTMAVSRNGELWITDIKRHKANSRIILGGGFLVSRRHYLISMFR